MKQKLSDKLRMLRKSKQVSIDTLAGYLNVPRSYIINIENGREKITDEYMSNLRTFLKIPKDIPITPKETEKHIEMLDGWGNMVYDGKYHTTSMFHMEYENIAIDSCDMQIQAIYAMHARLYYKVIDNQKKEDYYTEFLENNRVHLSNKHAYKYAVIRAAEHNRAGDRKSALRDYLYAEALCDRADNPHYLHHYNITLLLMQLGYTYKAKEYLDKTYKSAKLANKKLDPVEMGLLEAIFYYRDGSIDRALDTLRDCLEIEERRALPTLLDPIYHNIGYAYLLKGKYDLAIENFDKALLQIEKDTPSYYETIYFKARVAYVSGSFSEDVPIPEDYICGSMLKGLKCLANLDKTALFYMKNTLFPKLIDAGEYRELIFFYDAIETILLEQHRIPEVNEYSQLMSIYSNKLLKGEVCYYEDKKICVCSTYGNRNCPW
jgi:tetratricopeptide (TPR) repeat protein